MADSLEIACEICQKSFTQKCSLKRHYKEIHPSSELPDNFKEMKDPKETCSTCSKEISRKHFQRHLKSCGPKEEQQLPLSSAEQRKMKSIEVTSDSDSDSDCEVYIKDKSLFQEYKLIDSEIYIKDESLFQENKPIEPMMHEFYSQKWCLKDFSRQHINNYIGALKKFERSFARRVELTPKTLMECFQSRFDDYFDSLQTVSERRLILLGLQRTFEMLAYTNVISTVPEIRQLVDTKYIILRYFRSNLRSDYFQKLDRNAAEFAQAVGPMSIRNFLLTETILATKSSEFVHQLTREMFLNGTKIIDSNQQTKWIIDIGQEKAFEIPDFLKEKLQVYLFAVRKHVLPKVKQNGKDNVWDPNNDSDIKFFAVSERGRPFVVEVMKSVFDVFHMGAQSHKTFQMKDFIGTEVQYKIPEIGQ